MHPRFRLIGEILNDRPETRGGKLALRDGSGPVSYDLLRRRMWQVAGGLRAMGIGPGQRIAYLAANTAAFYEILFGAAAIGAVLVPINWRLTPRELSWILDDSQIDTVFVGAKFADRLPARCRPIVVDDGAGYAAWRDAQAPEPIALDRDPEDVVVQLYTSGTTGTPKGAMLSHRALLAFRSLPPEVQPEWNRWTGDDVSLIVMPQFHIGGTGFGLQTLCAGATGFVAEAFDAALVLDLIANERLSKLFTVPSAIKLILQQPHVRTIDYSRIRTIVYGASPIPIDLLREAMEVFQCSFVQQYGMTETSGTICVLPPEDHTLPGNDRMRSAGKPLDGVSLRILDDDGAILPPGAVGEIAVASPTLMSGYWNLPDASAASFTADGHFRTGDAGFVDADGYLFLKDRVKDMIVSGGENVYPAEVEAVLRRLPGVDDVAVIGVPDPLWGEAVKAIVVRIVGAEPDESGLIAGAREWLAGYKLPKSVAFVDVLPRNAAGKVLKRELRERYSGTATPGSSPAGSGT